MWLNPQETVDLVTFTEEILNEKLHILSSVISHKFDWYWKELKELTV